MICPSAGAVPAEAIRQLCAKTLPAECPPGRHLAALNAMARIARLPAPAADAKPVPAADPETLLPTFLQT